MAHKGEQGNKKEKKDHCIMDHYANEFPDELQEYILDIIDVQADGNLWLQDNCCDQEESWSLICEDLIQELQTWNSVYVQLFGSEERLLELITSLYVEHGSIPYEKQMTILDVGYAIASRYNVVLVHLSRLYN